MDTGWQWAGKRRFQKINEFSYTWTAFKETNQTPKFLDSKLLTRWQIIEYSKAKAKKNYCKLLGKNLMYRSITRRLSSVCHYIFRRQEKSGMIFTVLEDKNFQSQIAYAAKLSFKYERETKILPNVQKMKKFTTKNPNLQKLLKWVLIEKKSKSSNSKYCDLWFR